MVLIVVNKRINQRFFSENKNGVAFNPPSGTVIDTNIVANDSDSKFDFYMIPQYANQGCVLPTHFYVALNESTYSKKVIERFTFALCHYYFNWGGPIKVPAPCMYAHKIAELFHNVESNTI